MKFKHLPPLLISVFYFLSISCSTLPDRNPGRSDLIVGQWYEIQKPAYIFTHNKEITNARKRLHELGYARTSSDLNEFIKEMPSNPRVAGLVVRGDKIKIIKTVLDQSATLGEFTDVWAVIMTGDAAGIEIEISGISKSRKPSTNILRDPTYLEPITGQ